MYRFELLLPWEWTSEQHKPVYIHLAGTGDHVSSPKLMHKLHTSMPDLLLLHPILSPSRVSTDAVT